jgi:hypothetical protein
MAMMKTILPARDLMSPPSTSDMNHMLTQKPVRKQPALSVMVAKGDDRPPMSTPVASAAHT